MSEEVNLIPEQYDFIADIQQEILARLAADEPAIDILNALCLLAESCLSNAVASIVVHNENSSHLSVLSAPSIAVEKHPNLVKAALSPFAGACANAILFNEAQFVENTFTDERWRDIRQFADDCNIHTCWSIPIKDKNNQAVGSFALSSFEPRIPTNFHKKLLETSASIVNIVLQKQQRENRLNLLSSTLDSASECIIVTDSNNIIIEVNPAFEQTYGFSVQEVIGKNPSVLASGIQSEAFYNQLWHELNTTGRWCGEITNKRLNGSFVTHWMSITAVVDAQGELQNYLSIFSDLTELKTTQQQVIDMAFYDTVTGLRNKTCLEKEIMKCEQKHTLILLNISNFNHLNTAYGFNIGDLVLKKTGEILTQFLVAADVFRLSSDQFGVLFQGEIDITAQVHVIQSHFYNTLINVENILLHIAFTFGAVYGKENLLRNAALALNQAKLLGKNRYHIFDPNSEAFDNVNRDHFIASNHLLHTALERDLFVPYFQGIYDNKHHHIEKFEVLVRIDDNGKILSPYQFLETARLSGLLPEITRVVIDKSFKVMAKNSFKFSLNITEFDLSQNYLIAYLQQKTAQYNIDPNRIILEILEGVSSSGKKNHIQQLHQLKSQGYSLAIDDFGTEYSNFERILDLDIDYLKIDANYIKNIDTNKKSYEITKAITFFAHNANIPCIAEFVHNQQVQEVVTSLGIDYSQGYHFSEPAPQPIILPALKASRIAQ